MAALEIRKVRKKLRQIESLEHLLRPLVPSECEKVARKKQLRRKLQKLLTQTVEEEPKEEHVETSEDCRAASISQPDSDIQPCLQPAATSKRKKHKAPSQAHTAPSEETPRSAGRLTDSAPAPLHPDTNPLQNSQFLVHRLESHGDVVTCVLIHDTYIISGSWDTSIRIWDIPTQSDVRTLCGHTGGIKCMVMVYLDGSKLSSDLLSMDEHFLCSGSWDCSINVWSLTKVQPLFNIYTFSAVTAIAHIPDTKLLVSGSDGGKIDVWNMETKENLQSERKHDGDVSALQIRSGLLYSGSSDGSVKIWNIFPNRIGSLTLLHSCAPLNDSLKGLSSICATTDQLYVATQGSCVKAVNWKEDRLTRLSSHNSTSGFVDALAATPDNLLISTGFNIDQGHGYLNIRDVKSGEYHCTLSCPDVSRMLCLAVSCSSNGLRRWVTGGNELILWEELPRGGVLDSSTVQVQFCPDFIIPAPNTDSEDDEDDEEDLWEAEEKPAPSDAEEDKPGVWQRCLLM